MVVSMRRRTLLRIAKKLPRCGPGLPHLPHALPLEMARVAEWFFAASDITRLYILELHEILGAPQSSRSAAGLVGVHRDGRWKPSNT